MAAIGSHRTVGQYHGGTGEPTVRNFRRGRAYYRLTMPIFMEDLERVYAALGIDCAILLGHSFGRTCQQHAREVTGRSALSAYRSSRGISEAVLGFIEPGR